ncbi:MAG TPA: hypothetical protein PK661_09640 [Syntrophorhabdaceae bacterium]|jgi:hypothetical protein|nr:hypothetical protein [Pseudomonadota bacterium]HOS60346.1 hypothetical protein [Syntrophorhabdaceae bacterium]
MEIYNQIEKRLQAAGYDLDENVYSISVESVIPSIVKMLGPEALLLSKEKIQNIIDGVINGAKWGLSDVAHDVLNTAVNNVKTNIEKVKINNIECYLIEERPMLKDSIEGYYIFDIRHDESGEPCTIEKNVWCNYFGTILSPVDFLKNGEDYVDINPCPECGGDCRDFIYLDN